MAKSIDLIFLNAFVLLNALFSAVPAAMRAWWPWMDLQPATSAEVALAGTQAKVDLRRRLIRTEPHAAP